MPIEALRPYQIEGVQFLTSRKRALLFDAVGLGKTIQAIRAAQGHGPVLIACNAYKVDEWEETLRDECPGATVVRGDGTPGQRTLALVMDAEWTIVTHAMLRRIRKMDANTGDPYWHMDYPLVRQYRTVILDESHHFAGKDSQRFAGAEWLCTQPYIEYVFLLTATPIRKDVGDLWPQLHLVAPNEFGSYWKFVQTWTRAFKDKFKVNIAGVKNPAKFKREVLAPHALGRNAKQVKLQIPRLITKQVKVALTSEEAHNYRSIKTQYRSSDGSDIRYDNPSQVLQALRRAAFGVEKLNAVEALAQQAESGGVIVFTWTHHGARLVAERLGVPPITGALSARTRAEEASRGRITVATIASLGEGVNVLAGRQTCIFAEEDYTPKSRLQAIGRVQRWSEQAPEAVRVYYVMSRGTVDERVHAAAEGRIGSLREIIDLELNEFVEA